MSVDSSTTIKVLSLKNNWAEIQVTEPDWLSNSHQGWIPIDYIEKGKASQKKEGWIKHTCKVYQSKSIKSKVIGYLPKPASIGVADDKSGWLKLIHAPVKHIKTHKYLTLKEMKEAYIKNENFSTTFD